DSLPVALPDYVVEISRRNAEVSCQGLFVSQGYNPFRFDVPVQQCLCAVQGRHVELYATTLADHRFHGIDSHQLCDELHCLWEILNFEEIENIIFTACHCKNRIGLK